MQYVFAISVVIISAKLVCQTICLRMRTMTMMRTDDDAVVETTNVTFSFPYMKIEFVCNLSMFVC